ncbi:MAG: hypothetical protein AAGH76_13915 [Pseudomonadota bacterium]
MSEFDWSTLLRSWEIELIELLNQIERLDLIEFEALELEAIRKQRLGNTPGPCDAIGELEARLGYSLSPSITSFFNFTAEWILPGIGKHAAKVLPAEEIDYFWRKYPAQYSEFESNPREGISDKRYFQYGAEQDPEVFRTEYARDLVVITTDSPTSFYFLNGAVRSADGELEAWYFSFHGGAQRFRTFFELMKSERYRISRSYREILD